MKLSEPINLDALYGKRFQITVDESQGKSKKIDPWYYIIPCKNGAEIYPHSDKLLSVMVLGKHLMRKVSKIPDVILHQSGEEEAVYLFLPQQLKAIAAIVKPKRKRVMSAEAREKLAKRLEIARSKRCKR